MFLEIITIINLKQNKTIMHHRILADSTQYRYVKNPIAAVASFFVELSQEFDEILHVNSLKAGLSKEHFWFTSFLIGKRLSKLIAKYV
jgi:hypothetical protein